MNEPSLRNTFCCGEKIEELISFCGAKFLSRQYIDILSFLNNLCSNITREKSVFNQIDPCYTRKIITFSVELLQEGALSLINSWAVLHARQIIQHPHSFKDDNYFVQVNISDFNPGHREHSWSLGSCKMTFLYSLSQENCSSLYKKFVYAINYKRKESWREARLEMREQWINLNIYNEMKWNEWNNIYNHRERTILLSIFFSVGRE